MGDDRPYLEERDDLTILELPVHWSRDDWPHFWCGIDQGGNLATPSSVLDVWLGELGSALADRRHVTYMMHPEIIGRGHRSAMLATFLETIRDRATIWFAYHGEICDHLRKP
jgi:hypothetical protein